MNNLINTLEIGKVFNKLNITPQNKNQVVWLSKQKATTLSAIHRPEKKLEFNYSVVDQRQQQQHECKSYV